VTLEEAVMAQKPVLSSKSDFHPNSAYRSIMNKIPVKIKMPKDVVTNYINAMIAYEALKSDENYKYLEAVKKEYKEFLASK
jgi:hypothetical protein